MRTGWSEKTKGLVRPGLYRLLHRRKPRFTCPICGYRGPFKDKQVRSTRTETREHSKCVRCGAAERHRLLWLVIDDVLENWNASAMSLLHIAPEFCLQERLRGMFGVYHTSDLFRTDVDFQEDIQKMSFEDDSYDCVFISRVFTSVPDLAASIREIRRILKPGGKAIISEAFLHEATLDYEEPVDSWQFHQLGLDLLEMLEARFDRVERITSGRFDEKFQLLNRIRREGRPCDQYPEAVRAPGEGYMELAAVCHAA